LGMSRGLKISEATTPLSGSIEEFFVGAGKTGTPLNHN
jgi:hypothetical protein